MLSKFETAPGLIAPTPEGAFYMVGGIDEVALTLGEGGQRLAMHQLAEALGISSKSEGAGATRHAVWYRPKGYAGVGEGSTAVPSSGCSGDVTSAAAGAVSEVPTKDREAASSGGVL